MPDSGTRSFQTPDAGRGTAVIRRFHGAIADELFVLVRPDAAAADGAAQARSAYQTLQLALTDAGAGIESLVSETVHFEDIARDYAHVRDVRARLLGPAADHSAATFIGQPPIDGTRGIELQAVAMLPHQPQVCTTSVIRAASSCTCPDCSGGMHARIDRCREESVLRAGDIRGAGSDAESEAYAMFVEAERLLTSAGMRFTDVNRTWIYLRDIDRDYDALNRARRRFFEERGIARRPASTGVQGSSAAGAHDFSMSLQAVQAAGSLQIATMSTPTLNEAWTYGADFSRGLRLTDANKVALHVSGTASIDECGRSVHHDDFERQADRMFHNIATLLSAQQSSFADLVSAVTYLKDPSDAPALRAAARRWGFTDVPCVVVEAPLCRPELLCETEAVALLPLPAGA